MKIIPLGTGNAFSKALSNTNFLILPNAGEPYLLDCGHTATRNLSSLGYFDSNVSTVLISHLHGDHIGGLEELGFTGYFLWKQKIALHLPAPLLPALWDNALKAAMGYTLTVQGKEPFDAVLDTYFEVHAHSPEAVFHIGSTEVRTFVSPHVIGRECYGFAIRDLGSGGTAMFTCDSLFSMENLENFGSDNALVFHDCDLLGRSTVHARLDELLALPEHMQTKILLTHLDDSWREYEGKIGAMGFAEEGKIYEL